MTHIPQAIQTILNQDIHEPFAGNPILLVSKKILEEIQLGDFFTSLTPKQQESVYRYIGLTAYALYLQGKSKGVEEAVEVVSKTISENYDKTVDEIEQILFSRAGEKSKKIMSEHLSTSLVENRTLEKTILSNNVKNAKKMLNGGGDGGSVIRFMMSVYNSVVADCKSSGIMPHIKNLTLGDVTGKHMPDDVVQALGYNPSEKKGVSISVRAQAYESILYDAGAEFDPHRYDLAALGWKGLRERFIEYGASYGLYPKQEEVKESLIGEGGAGTLYRVFIAARMSLEKKYPGKRFSAYFPNPAFRMVGDAARDADFEVIEVASKPSKGFIADPTEVDTYFSQHPECRVFVFIPIGNPNANFPVAETVKKLLAVLKKHDAILVNDFAYLGTGDQEKNKELAQVLATYSRRVDSYSMSKIFGRTGLRCGCAITTDVEIAEQFSPSAKHVQLGLSYPTQQVALSIWDYVTQVDRNVLNAYYKKQQVNLLRVLKNNKKPLIDETKQLFDEAGLYLYVPLLPGIDAFDVIAETGYFGVPASAFTASHLIPEGNYMRFALGVERVEGV